MSFVQKDSKNRVHELNCNVVFCPDVHTKIVNIQHQNTSIFQINCKLSTDFVILKGMLNCRILLAAVSL